MKKNYTDMISELTKKSDAKKANVPLISLKNSDKQGKTKNPADYQKKNISIYAPANAYRKKMKTLSNLMIDLDDKNDAAYGDLVILGIDLLTLLCEKLQEKEKKFSSLSDLQNFIEYLIKEELNIE